jgi:hypothetical protein
MDSVCDEIKEDMHKIEEDSKKLDCYAILDLILHSFKCFIDSIKCCFRIKVVLYYIHGSTLLLSISCQRWKT